MAVIRRDGTIALRIIQPGWGSSGYYPAEVLERDGPRVFKKGLKIYADHPTPTEEAERPERSVHDLAAELVSDAQWRTDKPGGPGLFADAKVFQSYYSLVEDLAPHIGVSIRASGKAARGKAEGRDGAIIQEITSARSVDLVTVPGAGGQIVSMFESARPARKVEERETIDMDKLKEAQDALAESDQKIARLQEALLLREAGDYVADALKGSQLPELTRARLQKALTVNPPLKEGALDKELYAARIAEAVTEEATYLQSIGAMGSGTIAGMGGTSTPAKTDTADQSARMFEAFKAMGMSDAESKIAATGRAR
jgi:hypothetical protein